MRKLAHRLDLTFLLVHWLMSTPFGDNEKVGTCSVSGSDIICKAPYLLIADVVLFRLFSGTARRLANRSVSDSDTIRKALYLLIADIVFFRLFSRTVRRLAHRSVSDSDIICKALYLLIADIVLFGLFSREILSFLTSFKMRLHGCP